MRAGCWELALTSAFFAASASFIILFSCFFSSESLTPAEERRKRKRSQGRVANQHTTHSSGGARTELAAEVLEERAGPLRQRLALRDLRRERGR